LGIDIGEFQHDILRVNFIQDFLVYGFIFEFFKTNQ
jgi:hypothetical protein